MEELKVIAKAVVEFYQALISLPLWAKIGAVVVGFLSPSVGIACLAVIAGMGIDTISRIYAEWINAGKVPVIESDKFKNKLRELIPFALGIVIIRLLEHVIGPISIWEWKLPNTTISIVFCILCLLRDCISVLENGAAAGFGPAQTMADILKIKRKDLIKKAKNNK